MFGTSVFSLLQASDELLNEHYIDLKDRPFFPTLIKYMSSGPVVAMVRDNTLYKTERGLNLFCCLCEAPPTLLVT